MGDSIIIRMATPQDADAIVALNREFNHICVKPKQVVARLDNGNKTERVLLAEVDNQVVGFACIQILCSVCFACPWAELMELYVRSQFRRRGLGKALVLHAENLAREEGASDMILRTGTRNTTGQGFYQALGYKRDNELSFSKPLAEQSEIHE